MARMTTAFLMALVLAPALAFAQPSATGLPGPGPSTAGSPPPGSATPAVPAGEGASRATLARSPDVYGAVLRDSPTGVIAIDPIGRRARAEAARVYCRPLAACETDGTLLHGR